MTDPYYIEGMKCWNVKSMPSIIEVPSGDIWQFEQRITSDGFKWTVWPPLDSKHEITRFTDYQEMIDYLKEK